MTQKDKEYLEYLKTDTWKRKANQRMQIDGYRCQGCKTCGSAENRLEVHHLSYERLGNENPYTDLVTVCHICHKNLHKIMERVTNKDGRRGWLDNPRIPQLHVYSLGGFDIEFTERTKENDETEQH